MAGPTVTSAIPSRTKLSDEVGFTHSYIDIEFDVPVQEFRLNLLGVSYDTGTIVHQESKDVSNLSLKTVGESQSLSVKEIREFDGIVTAEVDYTELGQEGSNKINIYGQSQVTKVWTS